MTTNFSERFRGLRVPVPRRASLDALLRYAWDAEVFTAGDALAATGLSRSTTIEAIDDLVDLGLVRELANARAGGDYRKGRPARRFELRADAAVVVGVDAGQGHLVTTVADLRGRPLATRTERVGADGDSAARRRVLVVEAIDAALAEAGVERADVLSVCVGVPAPVDSAGVSPVHRDGFWPRMNPDFAGLLSSWVPLVRIENDAVLASVAEHTRGAAVGLRNTVTVLAGQRLGAGVVIDGNLLRGAHGGVGEVVVIRHLRGVDAAHGIGHHLEAWARGGRGVGVAAGRPPAARAAPGCRDARGPSSTSPAPGTRWGVRSWSAPGRRWRGSRGSSAASTTPSGSSCRVASRPGSRTCWSWRGDCCRTSSTCPLPSSWRPPWERTSCRSVRWPRPWSVRATGPCTWPERSSSGAGSHVVGGAFRYL